MEIAIACDYIFQEIQAIDIHVLEGATTYHCEENGA